MKIRTIFLATTILGLSTLAAANCPATPSTGNHICLEGSSIMDKTAFQYQSIGIFPNLYQVPLNSGWHDTLTDLPANPSIIFTVAGTKVTKPVKTCANLGSSNYNFKMDVNVDHHGNVNYSCTEIPVK